MAKAKRNLVEIQKLNYKGLRAIQRQALPPMSMPYLVNEAIALGLPMIQKKYLPTTPVNPTP